MMRVQRERYLLHFYASCLFLCVLQCVLRYYYSSLCDYVHDRECIVDNDKGGRGGWR
jgi:hypothetical protein